MPGTAGRTGNFKTSSDTTQPDGLPEIPKGTSKAVASKWRELLPQLPQLALRKVDQHQLRMLCELLSLSDVLTAKIAADPLDHRTARLLLQISQQVHRLSACFGLTPGDRARLRLPTKDEDDPLMDWLESRGCTAEPQ